MQYTQRLGRRSGGTLHAHLESLQVEFKRFLKSARFVRMSGFWHSFKIFEIPLLSASNWHAQWINLFCPALHRSSQQSAGRSWFTVHVSLEHLKVEYCGSEKKCQNPEDLRIMTLFSDSRNSTYKCSKLACKENQTLSPSYLYTDPHSARLEIVNSLCMPVQSTWKWNIINSKKMTDSWGSQDSGPFSIVSKFHF
jgi:hypothetical protein